METTGAKKQTATTKDIALLRQLFEGGQLILAPEFQRESVWPRPAKAYLIDTILRGRPIPMLYFQRTVDPQTGRPRFSVIDGQQRLRAILEFLDDGFRVRTGNSSARGLTFSELNTAQQNRIQNYDLVVMELTGYTEADIKDVFVRMNKYVVKLSPQELRHARETGVFKEFVQDIGSWDFWTEHGVFSPAAIRRMRQVEFAAELVILVVEGPQDKKSSIDLYYRKYQGSFPGSRRLKERLRSYLAWIEKALPTLERTRYRKPVELYGLIGALDLVSQRGERISNLDSSAAGKRLIGFAGSLKKENPGPRGARYLAASSRQTDNLRPRETRMAILADLIARK